MPDAGCRMPKHWCAQRAMTMIVMTGARWRRAVYAAAGTSLAGGTGTNVFERSPVDLG
jgi:hypothetical protein